MLEASDQSAELPVKLLKVKPLSKKKHVHSANTRTKDLTQKSPWNMKICENRINKMSSIEPIIRTREMKKEVNGIPTQVVCTEFSNYIFVVITQYGKIGTLISVTPDSKSNDLSTSSFSTKVLLGKEEPLIHVCAKNLATFVSQEANSRPVLLGLALKDSSIDAIKQMKEIVKSCQVW